MSNAAVDPAAAADSDLCVACGLCCDGTIFGSIKLYDCDLPVAADERAVLVERRGQLAAAQPCGFLDGCRCTIYPSRYRSCRTFRCKLLRDREAGHVDAATASSRIVEAHRLRDGTTASATAAGIGGPMPAIRKGVAAWARDAVPPLDAGMATVRLQLAALDLFLARHFHARGQKADGRAVDVALPLPVAAIAAKPADEE